VAGNNAGLSNSNKKKNDRCTLYVWPFIVLVIVFTSSLLSGNGLVVREEMSNRLTRSHLTALGYPLTRHGTRGYRSGASRHRQQQVMVLVGIKKILILKEKHTIAPKANAFKFGLSFGPARESPQHPKLRTNAQFWVLWKVVHGGWWPEGRAPLTKMSAISGVERREM